MAKAFTPLTVPYAITFESGHLMIGHFVTLGKFSDGDPETGLKFREPTEAAINEEIRRCTEPTTNKDTGQIEPPVWAEFGKVKSWRFVDTSEVPQDRTFRAAWKDEGDKIGHDMDKVKEIHLSNLRLDRNAQLDKLDKDWMRATGQGKKQEADAIEAQRQLLRDLPTRVAADLEKATTPEQVKLIRG